MLSEHFVVMSVEGVDGSGAKAVSEPLGSGFV